MSIAGGRLDLAMAEKLSNHWQAFAKSESSGREAVSEVMDAYILESGLIANDLPRRVQVAHARAGFPPGKDPGAVGLSR